MAFMGNLGDAAPIETESQRQQTPEEKRDARFYSESQPVKRTRTPSPGPLTEEQKLARIYDKSQGKPVTIDPGWLREQAKLAAFYDKSNPPKDAVTATPVPPTGDKAQPVAAGDLAINLPDGVTVDEPTMAAFKGVAKEAGLSSEAASKLAAWDLARSEKATADAVATWEKQDDAWADEVKSDPEIGGARLEDTVADVRSALRRFGVEGLGEELRAHGLGNHPGLIRLLVRAERALRRAG